MPAAWRTRSGTSGRDFAPAWSPDGAWIAFRRGSAQQSELWIVRPDGSVPRMLASRLHDQTLPVWSPDSRELAFAARSDGSIEIHVVDVASGSLRTVAPSPAPDTAPTWSRDGSTIAFASERDGASAIYVVAHDGSNVRRWLDGRDPAFAPRADAMAYVRRDGIWFETGPTRPALAVRRADVFGRVDFRPQGAAIPAFAFSAAGRCGRYGVYVFVDGSERRLTNECEFRGNGVVRGSPFRDFLYGGRGADALYGRAGADLLVGGSGRDRIVAGPGADVVRAHDGRRDAIDCGSGRDVVYADRLDAVARSCEFVRR